MAAQGRSRRGPLTRFAQRSPFHAFSVWLMKSAVIGLVTFAVYLFVVNVAVPQLADGMLSR